MRYIRAAIAACMAFLNTVVSARKSVNSVQILVNGKEISQKEFILHWDYMGGSIYQFQDNNDLAFSTGVYSDPQIRNWSNCINLSK